MVSVSDDGGWRDEELLLPLPCQLIVAFDPSCPFSLQAAKEQARMATDPRLPTTWVAPGDSLSAARYLTYLEEGARIARSDEVWEALGVRAVPAGFLVDGQRRVRSTWRYRGYETSEDLEERCSASWPEFRDGH